MFEIEKKSKSKTVSLRFKEDEYKFIKAQAKKQNVSITDYFKLLLKAEYDRINTIQDTNTEKVTTTEPTTHKKVKNNTK